MLSLGTGAPPAFALIEATTMRMTWTNSIRCLLALGLMSGLVACGSLANCLNSGFVSVACWRGVWRKRPFFYTAAHGHHRRKVAGRARLPPGRIVAGLVLDDGSYWVFYSARDNPNVLAGLVQGTGTSHSGSFGSSNTRDFNLEGAGIRAATMSGSYVPNKSFHGTIAYFNGDTESFTSTYDADSESAPNLTLVAGTYAWAPCRQPHGHGDRRCQPGRFQVIHQMDAPLLEPCLLVQRAMCFIISVTLEGGACRHGTETLTGVALYDAATQRLYSAALNSARTTSFIFLGTKR